MEPPLTSSPMSESRMNFFGRTKFIYQRRQPRSTDRSSDQTLDSPGYAIASLGALKIDCIAVAIPLWEAMKIITFCNKKFVLKRATTSSIAAAIQIYSQCAQASYRVP